MNNVSSDIYYKCRGFYIQHKHGDFSTDVKVCTTEKDHVAWAAIQRTIRQDAFGKLLAHFKEIQLRFGVFTTSKGDFCLRMREKLFHFYPFVNALREAHFSVLLNLTTEPLKENHCLIGPQ